MKRLSYVALALIILTSMLVTPALAATPFPPV
jgi:hypothetical protein